MEWNLVLLWLVGTSAAVNLAFALRASPRSWGSAGVAAVLLAVVGVGYARRPAGAGLVAAALWAALVLVPGFSQRLVQRWTLRQRFDLARWPATLAGLLHPFDGVRQQARLVRAIDLIDRDDRPAAEAALRSLLAGPPRIAPVARLNLCRLDNDWAGWLDWVDAHVPRDRLRRDPALVGGTIRALGEAGRLTEMVGLAAAVRLPHLPALAVARGLTRLSAFAFAGQPDRVDQLFAGALAGLPPATRAFWLATADLAAGDAAAAHARLAAAEPTASPGVRGQMRHRRSHPPALAAAVLTPVDQLMLDQMDRAAADEDRYAAAAGRTGRPWATYALVAANLAMFAAELVAGHGDATDVDVLVRLGALLPDVFATGDYRELFLANFLHLGTAHLAMNMLALLALGPFVERSMGRVNYVAVYLLSGLAALATVVVLQQHHLAVAGPLVGASASIMALVGATAAVLLRGWVRERAAAAARRLRLVAVVLVVQVVFDHFVPQVSGAAHLAGAGYGFALASLLPHRRPRRPARGVVLPPSDEVKLNG